MNKTFKNLNIKKLFPNLILSSFICLSIFSPFFTYNFSPFFPVLSPPPKPHISPNFLLLSLLLSSYSFISPLPFLFNQVFFLPFFNQLFLLLLLSHYSTTFLTSTSSSSIMLPVLYISQAFIFDKIRSHKMFSYSENNNYAIIFCIIHTYNLIYSSYNIRFRLLIIKKKLL